MLLSVIFSIPFIFLLFLIKHFYSLFEKIIPVILIITLFSFVFKNKKSIIIVTLSGLLGFLTFHFNLLFPLLTGFFAVPNLLFSFDSKVNIQFFHKIKFSKKLIKTSFLASFLSSFFSIIPTISSSIVSTVAEKLGKLDDEEFISFISSTNLSYMVFSFYALSLLNIARSGSSVFLKTLEGNSFFYLGIILISAGFSFFICKKILFSIVKFYQKINPKLLPILGIFILIFISFLLNDFIGLLVLFTSSAIGLLAFMLKVPRVSCMSSLIIPTVFVLL